MRQTADVAAGEHEQQTWRPMLLGRVAFIILGAGFTAFALFALGAGLVGRQVYALVAAPLLAAWGIPFLLALRMRITLTPDYLEYRNLGAPKQIRWTEISDAQPGYWGIGSRMSQPDTYGEQIVTAMAVQKSNFSAMVGRRTKADTVADEVRRRATEADGSHGTPPAV